MKVSLNWLSRYIQLDHPIEKISEILTDIGLEVEGIEQVESIKGGLKGIVVGHVKECGKHPDADRLSLTKVDIGGDEDLSIVCGAPNVAAGQKVLVATIGSTLYSPEGEAWKIKKSKIRGELSEGMICAEDELGLGKSHEGIMVLPDDTPVATLASEYFNVESDVVFEIGLTPNRSDATSHYGVAKDVSAYLKINENNGAHVKSLNQKDLKSDNSSRSFKITIEDEVACPRYAGITISGIEVKESPDWLKSLLNSIGVRPINNIVDITNFILHDLGQPLHAFDADKIAKEHIIVSPLQEGSSFVSLDEKERKLSDKDLMICDGDKNPLCIAGVFGGISSGVTESTKNIFLESAHFNAGSIRKTSTRHLLRTDAAKVFEKGSDPNIVVIALQEAASMIKELAGGLLSSDIIDVYPKKIEPKAIQLNYDKVNTIIGTPIEREDINAILNAMEMELKPLDSESVMVLVPTNKADVLREEDLIEEILRIYGFNKVPIPKKIQSTIHYGKWPDKHFVVNKLANYLADNGFNEMMGLSLIESKNYKDILPIAEDKLVYINNTSNIHLDIMRPEPMLSGLESVLRNLNYQQNDLKLFEFGKSYQKANEDNYNERAFLSLYMAGAKSNESWQNNNQSVDFYDIKQWVNQMLNKLNIRKYKLSETEDPRFAYGIDYKAGKNTLVSFGAVDKTILKKMGIKSDVLYAEFGVANLLQMLQSHHVKIDSISKFPSTRRDLALVCDESVAFSSIEKITNNTIKNNLKEVGLFDVYRNKEQLGEGKKSYAVKFVFEDKTKTLNDKEVDKLMKDLTQQFETQLGAHIRN